VTSRLVCPEPIYRELALNFLPPAPKSRPEPEEPAEKSNA